MSTDATPVQPLTGAVRLGHDHGYRFELDTVTLNAELSIRDGSRADAGRWSLQLWACDEPHAGGAPRGTKIAEVPLALRPRGRGALRIDAREVAALPAAAGDYAMVLALAEDGELRDFANYARRERFDGPELSGTVGYAIEGDSVWLRADRVWNARAADNLSGSLALELRAHRVGGDPDDSVLLAAAKLGCLSGQYGFSDVARCVPFRGPAPGTWRLSLALREWTGAFGFQTRDRREFAVPYAVAEPRLATVTPLRLIKNDRAANDAEPAAEHEAEPAPRPTAPARPRAAAKAGRPDAAAGARPSTPPRAGAGRPGLLSVSRASVDELAALPGIGRKVAIAIVEARPFSSIDDLLRVHGIGKRTLAKLRGRLEL